MFWKKKKEPEKKKPEPEAIQAAPSQKKKKTGPKILTAAGWKRLMMKKLGKKS